MAESIAFVFQSFNPGLYCCCVEVGRINANSFTIQGQNSTFFFPNFFGNIKKNNLTECSDTYCILFIRIFALLHDYVSLFLSLSLPELKTKTSHILNITLCALDFFTLGFLLHSPLRSFCAALLKQHDAQAGHP